MNAQGNKEHGKKHGELRGVLEPAGRQNLEQEQRIGLNPCEFLFQGGAGIFLDGRPGVLYSD